MATGPLRFRTSHIDELPTAQARHAPGFAYVAVTGPQEDPAKNWGTSNRKRQRTTASGQTEQQREALTARQQREVERKLKELNSDNAKDVQVAIPKRDGGGGAARAGSTANTKKILASGKTFAHYLDDEEAEITRTGRRDGDLEVPVPIQRPSKTPIARREARQDSSMSSSPAPSAAPVTPALRQAPTSPVQAMDVDVDDEDDGIAPLPSEAEMEVLLDVPPLTYAQARSAPPAPGAPPSRSFCETCGYWGRVKCLKCGAMTCSVMCKDSHDEFGCLKFYA